MKSRNWIKNKQRGKQKEIEKKKPGKSDKFSLFCHNTDNLMWGVGLLSLCFSLLSFFLALSSPCLLFIRCVFRLMNSSPPLSTRGETNNNPNRRGEKTIHHRQIHTFADCYFFHGVWGAMRQPGLQIGTWTGFRLWGSLFELMCEPVWGEGVMLRVNVPQLPRVEAYQKGIARWIEGWERIWRVDLFFYLFICFEFITFLVWSTSTARPSPRVRRCVWVMWWMPHQDTASIIRVT